METRLPPFRLHLACVLASVLAAVVTLAARASAQPSRPPAPVSISILHAFGSVPIRADDVSCRTAAGNTVSISRLTYFLSNFTFTTADGTRIEMPETLGLINALTGAVTIDLPPVAMGQFKSIEFDIGVPESLNHADPATFGPTHPLNPTNSGLHWNWQGGYVFLAIEGRWVQPNDALGGYSYHIATDALRTRVTLPAQFAINGDTTLKLKFDAARVFASAHSIAITADTATHSTHSGKDDLLAPRLAQNAAAAFSFVSAARTPPAAAQRPHRAAPPPPIGTTPFPLALPKHFPQPMLPLDNPLTDQGVGLGKRLFNDPVLSAGDAQSCASCHQPVAAFADAGKALSIGVDGLPGSRNAMPLFNLAWSADSGYTWDGRRSRLRDQALAPISDVREMHLPLDTAVAKLTADATYQAQFAAAFGTPGITAERLGLAIEQYLLTLISADSKFDRVLAKTEEFTPQEQRGQFLFVTEFDPARGQLGADCFHCHGGTLFTDHQFRSSGLDVESADHGRAGVTDRPTDRGRFKTPSLRNIERTAPYMHDGRFATLEAVLEHYSEHIQPAATLDPNLAKHIITSPADKRRAGVKLSRSDRDALIAFLKTLTDDNFLRGDDARVPPLNPAASTAPSAPAATTTPTGTSTPQTR